MIEDDKNDEDMINLLHIDKELSEIKQKHKLSRTTNIEIKQIIDDIKLIDNSSKIPDINEKNIRNKLSIYFDIPYKIFGKIKKYLYKYYGNNSNINERKINPFNNNVFESVNIKEYLQKIPINERMIIDNFLNNYKIKVKEKKRNYKSLFSHDNRKQINIFLPLLDKKCSPHIDYINKNELRNEDTHGFNLFDFYPLLVHSDKYIIIRVTKDDSLIIFDLESFIDNIQIELNKIMSNFYNILNNMIKKNLMNQYIELISFDNIGNYQTHSVSVYIIGNSKNNYEYILPIIENSYEYILPKNEFIKKFYQNMDCYNIITLKVNNKYKLDKMFFQHHEHSLYYETNTYMEETIKNNILKYYYLLHLFS